MTPPTTPSHTYKPLRVTSICVPCQQHRWSPDQGRVMMAKVSRDTQRVFWTKLRFRGENVINWNIVKEICPKNGWRI